MFLQKQVFATIFSCRTFLRQCIHKVHLYSGVAVHNNTFPTIHVTAYCIKGFFSYQVCVIYIMIIHLKATSWSTNDDITDAHISAAIQQILTKCSAVVSYVKQTQIGKISAHLHIGNYVIQVHHISILRNVAK